MNQTIAWIILAVVIIVGVIFFMGRDNDSAPSNGEEQVMEDDGENMMAAGSFRDLLASNTSQECTFTDSESNSEGTVLVANGNMRGDFSTQVDGTETTAH